MTTKLRVSIYGMLVWASTFVLLSSMAFAQSGDGGRDDSGRGTIERTALDLKNLALSNLGNAEQTRAVMKAYSYVQASLDEEFWTDGNHLNPSFGRKVFQLERKAVNQLDKACKPGRKHYLGTDACSFVSASVNAKLAEADKKLAEIAFNEASGGVQKELNKASSELGKANDDYSSAGYKNAIKHYKLSWMHSMKAAGIDTMISDDED